MYLLKGIEMCAAGSERSQGYRDGSTCGQSSGVRGDVLAEVSTPCRHAEQPCQSACQDCNLLRILQASNRSQKHTGGPAEGTSITDETGATSYLLVILLWVRFLQQNAQHQIQCLAEPAAACRHGGLRDGQAHVFLRGSQ